jgi:predicted AAA+ superfamily ATPase
MKEILKTIIKDWQRTFPRAAVWERDLQVPLDSQKIISLIGPRRCGKTYYLKNKYECDFVLSENSIITQALQVCLTLQDEATRQREIRGLLHAAERFNLPEAHQTQVRFHSFFFQHQEQGW